MNRSTQLLAAAAGTLLLATPALAQERLYVASEGAKLKSDKSASSDTLAELPVGTPLGVLSQEDSWYKVSTNGQAGWIYRGKVAATPPEASKQGGDNLFGGLGSSSIAVSEADSARSMRGLTADDGSGSAKPKASAAAAKKALDGVLADRVGKKELESFLKAGHIGEYAK